MDTIKLFVGTSPGGFDYEAEAVFAWTATKLSSLPIFITWMRQAKTGPYSGWNGGKRSITPFSGFRWSCPAMCGFEGRSLYADVDVIWFADLKELWTQDIPGVLVCKKSNKPHGKLKTCVTLFDNAKAKGHIPTLDKLKAMADPQGALSKYFMQNDHLASHYERGNWNAFDMAGYELDDPLLKACHYTRLEHQVHLKHAITRLKEQGKSHWYTGPVGPHPRPELQDRFDQLLIEAKAAGYTYESFGYESGVEISRRNFTYTHSQVAHA